MPAVSRAFLLLQKFLPACGYDFIGMVVLHACFVVSLRII